MADPRNSLFGYKDLTSNSLVLTLKQPIIVSRLTTITNFIKFPHDDYKLFSKSTVK